MGWKVESNTAALWKTKALKAESKMGEFALATTFSEISYANRLNKQCVGWLNLLQAALKGLL